MTPAIRRRQWRERWARDDERLRVGQRRVEGEGARGRGGDEGRRCGAPVGRWEGPAPRGGGGDVEAAMGRWDRGVAPIQIGEGREGGVGRVGGSGEQWGVGFRSVDRGG